MERDELLRIWGGGRIEQNLAILPIDSIDDRGNSVDRYIPGTARPGREPDKIRLYLEVGPNGVKKVRDVGVFLDSPDTSGFAEEQLEIPNLSPDDNSGERLTLILRNKVIEINDQNWEISIKLRDD